MTNLLPDDRDTNIELIDGSNPRAIVNLLPPAVAQAVKDIPEEYFRLSEAELCKKLPKERPTLNDNKLRVAFWNEYRRAIETGTKMNVANVYTGTCTRAAFYVIIQEKARLCYIVSPPESYAIAMEEALLHGIKKIREILDFPLYDQKGNPNAKVAEVVLKAYQNIEMRVKGAIIQRVENKNLNLHVDGKKSEKEVIPESVDEIDAELRRLEAQAANRIVQIPEEIIVQAITLKNSHDDQE